MVAALISRSPLPTVTWPAMIPSPDRLPAWTTTAPTPVAEPVVFRTDNMPSVMMVPPALEGIVADGGMEALLREFDRMFAESPTKILS
jgi:hypothetical protein